MESHGESLRYAYNGLCGLRIAFDDARERGGFSVETVVPSRYLPELLMAAPVWFIKASAPSATTLERQRLSRGTRTPIMGEAVRYFCDLGVTDQFAYLFQMYNRMPKAFEQFTGSDIMPLPIVELVGKVKEFFDYLVIATPYHDLAAEEWLDTSWKRNIDPFLFGFLKQIPELMFFLGRWSGTGLFPLVTDMIADTIEHIRKNKGLLINFHRGVLYKEDDGREWAGEPLLLSAPLLKPVSYYKPAKPKRGVQLSEWRTENHTVVKFADNVLQHFENGTLFPWLRVEGQ